MGTTDNQLYKLKEMNMDKVTIIGDYVLTGKDFCYFKGYWKLMVSYGNSNDREENFCTVNYIAKPSYTKYRIYQENVDIDTFDILHEIRCIGNRVKHNLNYLTQIVDDDMLNFFHTMSRFKIEYPYRKFKVYRQELMFKNNPDIDKYTVIKNKTTLSLYAGGKTFNYK